MNINMYGAVRTIKWRGSFAVGAFALLVVAGGCFSDNSGPQTYPVSGTVTYNGEPAAGVNLTFLASGEGVTAQAMTDDQGAFEASTYFEMGKQEKPGMVAGEYRVTATKLDTASIKSTLQPPKDLLPRKYGSADRSGLTATVSTEEENHFVFELK